MLLFLHVICKENEAQELLSNLPKTNGRLRTEMGGDQSDSRTNMLKGFGAKEQTSWVGTRTLHFVSWAVDVACTLFLTLHGKEFHPNMNPIS